MQFQVPQFIEMEDKIFGPLTFKQFIYVAGGAGASYIFGRVLPFYAAAPLILIVGGLAAALAFYQYNGRPFIIALEHGLSYLIHDKLYLWSNKRTANPEGQRVAYGAGSEQAARSSKLEAPRSQVYVPKLSDSKLHELAWSLDIKEHLAEAENRAYE